MIVTAAPQHDYAVCAREAGADVYLPKHVDFRTLSDVVADDPDDRRRVAFSVASVAV